MFSFIHLMLMYSETQIERFTCNINLIHRQTQQTHVLIEILIDLAEDRSAINSNNT